jgi:hypothetical protein
VKARGAVKIAVDSYDPDTNEDVFMPVCRVLI